MANYGLMHCQARDVLKVCNEEEAQLLRQYNHSFSVLDVTHKEDTLELVNIGKVVCGDVALLSDGRKGIVKDFKKSGELILSSITGSSDQPLIITSVLRIWRVHSSEEATMSKSAHEEP